MDGKDPRDGSKERSAPKRKKEGEQSSAESLKGKGTKQKKEGEKSSAETLKEEKSGEKRKRAEMGSAESLTGQPTRKPRIAAATTPPSEDTDVVFGDPEYASSPPDTPPSIGNLPVQQRINVLKVKPVAVEEFSIDGLVRYKRPAGGEDYYYGRVINNVPRYDGAIFVHRRLLERPIAIKPDKLQKFSFCKLDMKDGGDLDYSIGYVKDDPQKRKGFYRWCGSIDFDKQPSERIKIIALDRDIPYVERGVVGLCKSQYLYDAFKEFIMPQIQGKKFHLELFVMDLVQQTHTHKPNAAAHRAIKENAMVECTDGYDKFYGKVLWIGERILSNGQLQDITVVRMEDETQYCTDSFITMRSTRKNIRIFNTRKLQAAQLTDVRTRDDRVSCWADSMWRAKEDLMHGSLVRFLVSKDTYKSGRVVKTKGDTVTVHPDDSDEFIIKEASECKMFCFAPMEEVNTAFEWKGSIMKPKTSSNKLGSVLWIGDLRVFREFSITIVALEMDDKSGFKRQVHGFNGEEYFYESFQRHIALLLGFPEFELFQLQDLDVVGYHMTKAVHDITEGSKVSIDQRVHGSVKWIGIGIMSKAFGCNENFSYGAILELDRPDKDGLKALAGFKCDSKRLVATCFSKLTLVKKMPITTEDVHRGANSFVYGELIGANGVDSNSPVSKTGLHLGYLDNNRIQIDHDQLLSICTDNFSNWFSITVRELSKDGLAIADDHYWIDADPYFKTNDDNYTPELDFENRGHIRWQCRVYIQNSVYDIVAIDRDMPYRRMVVRGIADPKISETLCQALRRNFLEPMGLRCDLATSKSIKRVTCNPPQNIRVGSKVVTNIEERPCTGYVRWIGNDNHLLDIPEALLEMDKVDANHSPTGQDRRPYRNLYQTSLKELAAATETEKDKVTSALGKDFVRFTPKGQRITEGSIVMIVYRFGANEDIEAQGIIRWIGHIPSFGISKYAAVFESLSQTPKWKRHEWQVHAHQENYILKNVVARGWNVDQLFLVDLADLSLEVRYVETSAYFCGGPNVFSKVAIKRANNAEERYGKVVTIVKDGLRKGKLHCVVQMEESWSDCTVQFEDLRTDDRTLMLVPMEECSVDKRDGHETFPDVDQYRDEFVSISDIIVKHDSVWEEGSQVMAYGKLGNLRLIFQDISSRTPYEEMVALHMDSNMGGFCSDSSYRGLKLFHTEAENILFCPLKSCKLAHSTRFKFNDDYSRLNLHDIICYGGEMDIPNGVKMNEYAVCSDLWLGYVRLIFHDEATDELVVALQILDGSQVNFCSKGIYKGVQLVHTLTNNIMFCRLDECWGLQELLKKEKQQKDPQRLIADN